jgi:hypothetical protein
MAGDAAPKFLIIVIALAGLSLCFVSATVFLFLELRKAKGSTRVIATPQATPVVVQSDESEANSLDEIPLEDPKPPAGEK